MFPSNTSFYSNQTQECCLCGFAPLSYKILSQFSFSYKSQVCQGRIPILLSRKQNIFPKSVSAFSFFIRNGPQWSPSVAKRVKRDSVAVSCRMKEPERKAEESFGKPSTRDPSSLHCLGSLSFLLSCFLSLQLQSIVFRNTSLWNFHLLK